MAPSINNKTGFLVSKDTTNALAKQLSITMAREGSAAASGTTAGFAVFGMSPGLLGALGLTAAVSATLTQVEFQYEKRSIRKLYAEELAAKMGKPVGKIKDKDLDLFAKSEGNATITGAVEKARKQRNIGVILSVVASLAALAFVGFAAPPMLGAMHLGSILTFVAEGAMGLFAYNAVKSPMHWVADKLTGIDEKNTHDHIVDILRDQQIGRAVTPQQLMGVFVAAHKELNEMIKSRYGDEFEDLPLAVKQAVTRDLSGPLHLEQLTADINNGKVNVTELAFAVEGKESGVVHSGGFEHAKPGKLRSMLSSVGGAVGRVANIAGGHFKKEYPALTEEITGDANAVSHSFVARLGHRPADNNVGYAERVEQSRAAESLNTQR